MDSDKKCQLSDNANHFWSKRMFLCSKFSLLPDSVQSPFKFIYICLLFVHVIFCISIFSIPLFATTAWHCFFRSSISRIESTKMVEPIFTREVFCIKFRVKINSEFSRCSKFLLKYHFAYSPIGSSCLHWKHKLWRLYKASSFQWDRNRSKWIFSVPLAVSSAFSELKA